jgi:hypothetical protein
MIRHVSRYCIANHRFRTRFMLRRGKRREDRRGFHTGQHSEGRSPCTSCSCQHPKRKTREAGLSRRRLPTTLNEAPLGVRGQKSRVHRPGSSTSEVRVAVRHAPRRRGCCVVRLVVRRERAPKSDTLCEARKSCQSPSLPAPVLLPPLEAGHHPSPQLCCREGQDKEALRIRRDVEEWLRSLLRQIRDATRRATPPRDADGRASIEPAQPASAIHPGSQDLR